MLPTITLCSASWACRSGASPIAIDEAEQLAGAQAVTAGKVVNVEPVLCQAAGEQFYNTSPLTMTKLLDDSPNIADNLRSYLLAFSSAARDLLEKFDLPGQIDRLDRADLLYLVMSRFCDMDLHPDAVSKTWTRAQGARVLGTGAMSSADLGE